MLLNLRLVIIDKTIRTYLLVLLRAEVNLGILMSNIYLEFYLKHFTLV